MTETAKSVLAKAEHERYIVDIRRRHADAISHALFDEIRHLLPRDIERDVAHTLRGAIYRNRTMIISDREAERLGLEPKDRQGWTPSERVKMEQDRIAAMHQIATAVYKIGEQKP